MQAFLTVVGGIVVIMLALLLGGIGVLLLGLGIESRKEEYAKVRMRGWLSYIERYFGAEYPAVGATVVYLKELIDSGKDISENVLSERLRAVTKKA